MEFYMLAIQLLCISSYVIGQCVTKSGNYSVHSVWKEDPCTQCHCSASLVPICHHISCKDPGCRHEQGEVLQIPEEGCCPICARLARECQINSTLTIQDQSSFLKTPCEKCTCHYGNLRCSVITCPEVRCPGGKKLQNSTNECCPVCVSVFDSCSHDNKLHPDGSSWIDGKCALCSCHHGQTVCRVPSCPKIYCGTNESIERDEFGCCLKCIPAGCHSEGKTYQDGHSWKKGVCTHCICIKGQTTCTNEKCSERKRCDQDENLVWKPDQCCPVRAKKTGMCESNGRLHYSGDIWRGSHCKMCSCHHGNVRCHQLHCQLKECQANQVEVTSSDGCCQTCEKRKSCQFDGKIYQHNQTWKVNPCQTCICKDGGIHCFKEKCPLCKMTTGSDRHHGDCCQCASRGTQSDQPGAIDGLTLSQNKPAVVMKGGTFIIAPEFISLHSGKAVQDVQLIVVEGPNSGRILEAETERSVTTFRWKDLLSRRVVYAHNGEDTTPDKFLLQAFDGQEVDTAIFDVVITDVGLVQPVMLRNSPLLVEEGMTLVEITKNNIRATPRAEGAYDVIYTLTPTTGNPKSGRILYLAPVSNYGIIPDGWRDIGGGQMAARMYRFLQRDLDRGRIYYERTKSDHIGNDSLIFAVSDTSNPPNILENITLQIQTVQKGTTDQHKIPPPTQDRQVTEATDAVVHPAPRETMFPVERGNASNGTSSIQVDLEYVNAEPPEVVDDNPILELSSGGTVGIGPEVIRVSDPDTPLSDLRFKLEETPIAGELFKRTQDSRVILRKGDTFTHDEFKSNTFFYTHQDRQVSSDFDLLWFTITDGAHNTGVGVTLRISGQPPGAENGFPEPEVDPFPHPETGSDVHPPIRKDPSATFELNIDAGSRVTLTPDQINFLTDVPDEEVTMTLASFTTIGKLYYRKKPMKPGHVFTQQQLKDGIILFKASDDLSQPSATEGLYFNATASGATLAYQSVKVTVNSARGEAPQVRVGQPPMVEEGGRLVLTLDDIHVTDKDSSPSDVTIDIQTPPVYGHVEKATSVPGSESLPRTPMTSFTLGDLIQGHVHYVQTSHQEMEPIQDYFRFVVKDNRNISPVNYFNITIKLVNDEPPLISTSPIVGMSLQRMVVNGNTLLISDLDTQPHDLHLTLLKAPSHGILKVKDSLLDLSDNIKYEDVVKGYLSYTNTEEADTDDFTVQVTDGQFTDTASVVIQMTQDLVVTEIPRLTVENQLKVLPGPQFEFMRSEYMIDESAGIINVTVVRQGHLHLPASVICYTIQQTAEVMMDFQERPFTSKSRIFFQPGEKFKSCCVEIVADQKLEPDEMFLLKLANPETQGIMGASLGLNTTTVFISNIKDVPRIEFKEAFYVIPEPEVPYGVLNSVHIEVIRQGDSSLSASVRCSTKDGSAKAGKDYQAQSQLLMFAQGQREFDFMVNILHNPEREWEESFYVVLGPQDPDNAMLGETSVTTVAIVDSRDTGSSVLPAPPMVVPFDVYNGQMEDGIIPQPKAGQPVVCVSPCDPVYPMYSETGPLCEKMHIDQSDISYNWEVAPSKNNWGNYQKVCDDTPFTDTTSMVLDRIYFQPDCRVRCGATVRRGDHVGTTVTSSSATIQDGRSCFSESVAHSHPNQDGFPQSRGQSFVTDMEYLPPDTADHPNSIHLGVRIPHQDGMLPLVSTSPIRNINFLLTKPVYQEQHSCSNFASPDHHPGFLSGNPPTYPRIHPKQTKPDILDIYNNLDRDTCTWTFDAWYPLSDFVDHCGGEIISNTVGPQGGVEVKVSLYVSYVFNQEPGRWTSLDHHTDLQVHMNYNPMQWSGDMRSLFVPTGHLDVRKLSTTDQGNLIIDFETSANFPGQFIGQSPKMEGMGQSPKKEGIGQAPKMEGIVSRVTPHKDLPVAFILTRINQPNKRHRAGRSVQTWRAQSSHSLKDYSGVYSIDLIPCIWTAPTPGSTSGNTNDDCHPGEPYRFEVPIVYQQTLPPVPFPLTTHLEVTNDPQTFDDPGTSRNPNKSEVAFDRGQTVYGRVILDPGQNLDSTYELRIENVFICTGPQGKDAAFNSSIQQNGCLGPSRDVEHRSLILDGESPDVIVEDLGGIPLNARLARDENNLSNMVARPGEDAFAFSVDPLFQVGAGRSWYIQVLYAIGASPRRFRRSSFEGRPRRDDGSGSKIVLAKIVIRYNEIKVGESLSESESMQLRGKRLTKETGKNVRKESDVAHQSDNAQSNGDSNIPEHLPYALPVICTLACVVVIGSMVFSRYRRKTSFNAKNLSTAAKNNSEQTSHKNVGLQAFEINFTTQL